MSPNRAGQKCGRIAWTIKNVDVTIANLKSASQRPAVAGLARRVVGANESVAAESAHAGRADAAGAAASAVSEIALEQGHGLAGGVYRGCGERGLRAARISLSTADRAWRYARAWLYAAMADAESEADNNPA